MAGETQMHHRCDGDRASAGTIRLDRVLFRRVLESEHRRVHLRLPFYRGDEAKLVDPFDEGRSVSGRVRTQQARRSGSDELG
jgi:hypothetical protein